MSTTDIKLVIKMEPVKYIEFEDNISIEAHKLIRELTEMRDADWSEFHLNSEYDNALYKWIKFNAKDVINYETNMGCNTMRIYWVYSNISVIDALIDKIYDLAFSEE